MKLTIRRSTFETNSSSTHSMIIGMEDDFKKLDANELLLVDEAISTWEDAFKRVMDSKWDKERLEKYCNENNLEVNLESFKKAVIEGNTFRYEGYNTMDQFADYKSEYLECAKSTYTTPAGEKIRVVAWYGYDG